MAGNKGQRGTRGPSRPARGGGGAGRGPQNPVGQKGVGQKGVGQKPAGRGQGQRGTTPVRRDRESGPGGEQVEGRQAVRELLLAGRRRVREVYLAGDLDPAPILEEIIDLADEAKVPIREVSRGKFESMAKTDAPQGVLAYAAPLPDYDLDALARTHDGVAPFLLVLDGVTDPGNLGALLRTAECAGVTGVVIPRHRAARITATVTKAAAGAVEHLPIATVSGIPTALTRLRDAGVWCVGLDVAGSTTVYELTMAEGPTALVLGAEGKGIARLVKERCDLLATIPILGALGSLNVAAAAAVACFEVVRRRTEAGR